MVNSARRRRHGQARSRTGWPGRLAVVLLVLLLLPLGPILVLRWWPPPTTAFMLQARFGGLADAAPCGAVAYRWVPWQDISEHAKMAVIASEDQRFAWHWGIDLQSIGEVLQDSEGGSMRGASTITQQVAKNLFLWPGRSWLRKSMEAYVTLLLEASWPKQRILEVYLNVAQFDGCTFGVAAASESFFDVGPAQLNPRRAALLAAVLPNPVRLRADSPSDYVDGRAGWIESQMRQLGGASYLEQL